MRKLTAGTLVVVLALAATLFATANHAYIDTPSMYPTIPPGSMVFISAERHYHAGEVVEFRANGLLWVHRITAIEANGDIITKGDNPESTPDVFVPPRTAKDIVGAVVVSVPYLGFPELIAKDPSYGLSWLRAELGFVGRLIIVLMVGSASALVALRPRRLLHSAPARPSRRTKRTLTSHLA